MTEGGHTSWLGCGHTDVSTSSGGVCCTAGSAAMGPERGVGVSGSLKMSCSLRLLARHEDKGRGFVLLFCVAKVGRDEGEEQEHSMGSARVRGINTDTVSGSANRTRGNWQAEATWAGSGCWQGQ